MNKKALNIAICMALAFPTVSHALSLGDIESNSSLNQPFRGKINLLATSVAEAKTLRIRVAPAEVFNRVGIDRPAFLNGIRFKTTIQNGKPVILVSSNQAINEPFLNFLLEVSWPNGQLLKEYTVLLDPPVLMRPDTAIAKNTAGVRAQPKRTQAGGVITRPAVQQQRVVQQQQRAQQQRQKVALQNQRAQQQRQRAALQKQRAAQKNRVASRTASSQVRTYRVKKGDNLSAIARKMGYRGIQTEQMIMAFYAKNRRAFTKNNINNLKAGATLTRPSLQEARKVSSRAAKAQVIAQARAWKKDRPSHTQIANKGSKTSATKNSQARLEVVGSEGKIKAASNSSAAGNASNKRVAQQLALANESLTSRLKENEELKSRVAELSSLLRKKNRLITLKSRQLAQLQENISATTNSSAAQTEPVIAAPSTTTPITGENAQTPPITMQPTPNTDVNIGNDIQQQVANDLANQQGEIIRNSPDPEQFNAEPETVVGENSNGQSTSDSPFAEDVVSGDSEGILSLLTSPIAMGVGGGTLLALFGGWWFMRRRKDSEYEEYSSIDIDDGMDSDYDLDEEDDFADSFTDEDDNFGDSPFKTSKTVEATAPTEDVTQESPDDLLQEADVYIVYGLHDQAESELKQAIDKEPNNLAYRAKLIENYKAAGDKASFEAAAKEFMALNGSDKGVYLEEINEWGKALIPDSPLFNGGLGIKSAGLAAGAAGVAITAGMATQEEVEDLVDSLGSSEEIIVNEASIDELESFDLDDVLTSESTELEYSLPLDDEEDDFDSSPNFAFDESDEVMEQGQFDSFDSLLADDSDLTTNNSREAELKTKEEPSFDNANLNLDLNANDFDKILPESSSYTSKANVDFDTTKEVEDNLLAEFDDNLSFLDLDDDTDEIEESQVNTKLDLAKAYIDMGDIEGARSTLEEVMQDGSESQKREAEDLLHQTG